MVSKFGNNVFKPDPGAVRLIQNKRKLKICQGRSIKWNSFNLCEI
jgi:hypothetical protein